MIRPDIDSAQVRIPPPLLLIICLSAGIGFEKWRPFPFLFSFREQWIRWLGGSAWILVGMGLILSAVISFKKAHTALEPWRPSSALVNTGIFRFLRNPIYLGFLFIGIGFGFFLNSIWVLIAQLGLFVLYRFYVIPKEEAYLQSKFGKEYQSYCAKVKRWGV
jgi:protein-S-isoprenylcysteine O-methyltransferase Ste14